MDVFSLTSCTLFFIGASEVSSTLIKLLLASWLPDGLETHMNKITSFTLCMSHFSNIKCASYKIVSFLMKPHCGEKHRIIISSQTATFSSCRPL